MPRDLAHVIHHFLPEAGRETELPAATQPPVARAPAALPLLALPIGDRDVVRAAFAWNLAVEIARLGGKAAIVAPRCDPESPLWPEPGIGPLGTKVMLPAANNLGELHRCALDASVQMAGDAHTGGVVLVRVPPSWLKSPHDGLGLLRWTLLLTSADSRDLVDTYGLAKLLLRASSESRIGVTIHGAGQPREARKAFTRLADAARRLLGRKITSYGMLVDDLHVYRAIVSKRPIGLAHPQSRAARALRDVAEMLLESARERAVV